MTSGERMLKSDSLKSQFDLETDSKRRKDLIINNTLIIVIMLIGVLNWLPIVKAGLFAPIPSLDFGSVKAGDILKGSFLVTNMHPWPVTVVRLTGDCGCTNVFPKGRNAPFRLNASESIPLQVSVDTANRTGPINRIITVSTRDFRSNQLIDTQLTMRAVLK